MTHEVPVSLPSDFDARTNWPKCETIGEIRDQSDCGSCWAFGATEAASDRVCIGTNGAVKARLSAEVLTGCCWMCGNGCNGGYPSAAWDYFVESGVPTGGAYDDFSLCSSYTLKPCDHHSTGQYGPCPSKIEPTPQCPTKCDAQSTYKLSFDEDRKRLKFDTSYQVSSSPEQIMTEIMTNGPVEAAFTVYADFESYKGGVYHHVTGEALGGHAIRILGWGVDQGKDYWLVANSWNTDWGEKGFFRISRGNDECGIESGVVAGKYSGKNARAAMNVVAPIEHVATTTTTHYEDPKPTGCEAGEMAIQILGLSGDFCSPTCSVSSPCPTDVPAGTTATPQCALSAQGSASATNCALICDPNAATSGCPTNASCKAISGTGLCTYDD